MTPREILARKLALERRLTSALAPALQAYLAAWADGRSRGLSGAGTGHVHRVEAVLAAHYADVSRAFGAEPSEIGQLAFALRANTQARYMLGTIDRDLANAEREERSAGKSDGVAFEVKADAAVMPRGKWSVVLVSSLRRAAKALRTRLPFIANAETQDVAEAARAGQIDVVPPGQEQGVVVKEWNSLLDGRERPAHGAAHGQAVPVANAFEVGGEQMRFPGDGALGASLGNRINCRCWANYYLEKPDGSRVPLGVATPKVPARRTYHAGDRVGVNVPGTPTTAVTFPTGRLRADIILGNGKLGRMTVDGGQLSIREGGKLVASAPVRRAADGTVSLGPIQLADTHRGTGIEQLLRRSVDETNKLRPFPGAPQ